MSDAERAPARDAGGAGDLSGRRVGDYQIIRRLGQGGMADVYLAQQESLCRHVAFKVLKPELAKDEQYIRRFRREAQAAAALVQANIVQIHEVGYLEGQHFIAQEYVRGQNVKERLKREGSFSPAETVRILRQVAGALAKAAEHRIVHRDIKPENIMIGGDGVAKVADFGLARQGPRGDGLELTEIGITMGTPLYMSPEQIQGKPLDPRTDLYSLGVTAYEMLAGRPPFEGETPLGIAVQHINNPPPPLPEQRPGLPSGLCEMLHGWLSKDPTDRPADAAAAILQLDALGIETHPQGPSRGDDQDSRRRGTVSPLAATQRLARALGDRKETHSPRFSRQQLIRFLLTMVLGCGLAWVTRRPDPLRARPGEGRAEIPKQDSPGAQYFYATMKNTESAWQSVLDYFPADATNGGERQPYYAHSAKVQLARWYLNRERPREALPILKELTELDAAQRQFRAQGFALQARAYAQEGDYDQAAEKLSSVWGLRDALDRETLAQISRLRDQIERRNQ